MAYTSRDIDVIEGLEAIRRRPTMYIGEETPERNLCSRLVECVAGNVAAEPPPPTAIRIVLWMGGVVTIGYDGEPLPIRPSETATGVAHPELYFLFMYLFVPGSPLQLGAAIVNALSERLVVSTVHDGVRYRAAFMRGGLVTLLSKSRTEEAFGTNWFTFKPDATLISGIVDAPEAARIATSVMKATPGASVTAIDRSSQKPDWW